MKTRQGMPRPWHAQYGALRAPPECYARARSSPRAVPVLITWKFTTLRCEREVIWAATYLPTLISFQCSHNNITSKHLECSWNDIVLEISAKHANLRKSAGISRAWKNLTFWIMLKKKHGLNHFGGNSKTYCKCFIISSSFFFFFFPGSSPKICEFRK